MNQFYKQLVVQHILSTYQSMYREPTARFAHPYIVPGAGYETCLWDWDTYFASLAIMEIMDYENASQQTRARMVGAMQGCILNMLSFQLDSGALPYSVYVGAEDFFARSVEDYNEPNQHKPVLAQFIEAIWKYCGDLGWIATQITDVERFLQHYSDRYFDARTGLFFWRSGAVIGVDNDPCTFGRPRNSSGSIYLNTLFVAELAAMAAIEEALDRTEMAAHYREMRDNLIAAIQKYCWDKRDKFYYSVDLHCATEREVPWLNSGLGVFWNCIPLRIRLWTGFMPMWAGFASQEQASALVKQHLTDTAALAGAHGMRTLAANEPMYDLSETSNPSNWLGPVWIINNYIIFQGLVNYGYMTEAKALCSTIVDLLGRDIEANGGMHEYYHPDTGEGIMNLGFMNWNYLAVKMIVAAEG
jgi:putative isomerase